MRFLSAIWFSVRGLVAHDRVGEEIDEELAYHIEREGRMLEQSGLAAVEARREARRRFGGTVRYREECRDVRRVSLLGDLATDLRFTVRLARHQPGFTASVVLISAVGIAACVTTFSLVSGILLAPLSFPGQDRVFNLYFQTAEGVDAGIPVATWQRIAHAPLFDGVTATEPTSVTLVDHGEAVRLEGATVSPSFFRVYQPRPVMGRAFTDEDVSSRAPVVILSYEQWKLRYGEDRNVVGQSISVDGSPHTVVGIMPPGFFGNFEGNRFIPVIWQPMPPQSTGTLNISVRLADSVSPARAAVWLRTMMPRKVASYRSNDSLAATPLLAPIAEMIYGDVQQPLLILLASVALVLLLVAANIATMFLARSSARASELGVRAALGASAGRQFRQLITESITLTGIGGAIALAASAAAVSTIRSLGQLVLPRIDNVAIDWRVALFALGGILLTGLVGGVAHVIAARSSRPGSAGTGGSRFTVRSTSAALVVAQVALSVMLLSGAGLMVKGFLRVAPRDPGFTLHNRAVLSLSLRDPADSAAARDVARGRHLTDAIEARLRGVAGVEDVALTSFVPLSGLVSIQDVQPEGSAPGAKRLSAYSSLVSPNFFTVMRIPVLRGRAISRADADGAERVAVINETAAEKWWPGTSAVGQRLAVGRGDRKHTVTVVGVVGGTRTTGRTTRSVPELYEAEAQSEVGWATFIVATAGAPGPLLPSLRRAVHDVAPRLPLMTAQDLAEVASESVRIERFYSVAMSLFAIAAVILAALGIHGLLSFAVAQRRREIGIRMALGATTARIGRSVIARALAIGMIGVGLGGLLARGLTRYMASVLAEVKPSDPVVFSLAITGVLLLAVVAACAPAYQATRVDPVRSLRT